MNTKKVAKTSIIAVSAVAIAGLAFAAPSIASTVKHTSTSISSTASAKGHGHGFGNDGNGGPQGQFGPGNEVSQNVTVDVPADGGTYKLVVTQTGTPAVTNNTNTNSNAFGRGPGDHTTVVAITGTGSVTVSVPGLHPGTYKAELVKVSSSQDITVAAPAATPASK